MKFQVTLLLIALISVGFALRIGKNNTKRQLPGLSNVLADPARVNGLSNGQFVSDIATNIQDRGFDVDLSGPRRRVEDTLQNAWITFKNKFHKVYFSAEEEMQRREIFIENTAKVFRLNDDYAQGYVSFAQKLNGFADMLHHEFATSVNGFNRSLSTDEPVIPTQRPTAFIPSANVPIPDAIDWRQLGAVTAVRSQGLCAGCYAFSAAGALEGQYYRKTGILHELSTQNLIDCSREYGNNGCKGGLMNPAFQYVKDNHGIDKEEAYFYEAADNQCRYQYEGIGADSTGYVQIPEGDEESLKLAVATIGPISAAMDASRNTFQFYSEGVYFDVGCKNETRDMNHAVLIVGYDIEPNGKQYWWVKNSYGDDWGIGGYAKIARNAGNHCGIASLASYPLV